MAIYKISVKSAQLDNLHIKKASEIFLHRIIDERNGFISSSSGDHDIQVILDIYEGIGKEAYRINVMPGRVINVTGNDKLGLLYGVGKLSRMLCHGCVFDNPEPKTIISIPESEIRGVYFATHFHNFYHDAPIERVEEYLEDITLWGANTLAVWFDMHHYHSIRDPEAENMLTRLLQLLNIAKNLGLKTSLTLIANESFAKSPRELRADWKGEHNGYKKQLAGHYHIELCPNKLGAFELLLQWREDVFRAFSDINLDYIVLWPYDQGGCTCSQCSPWGTNGFLKLARPISELAKKYFPGVKTILSTWMFDTFTDNEWEDLINKFQGITMWADFLLAEFPNEGEPPFINKCIPEDFPLVGFPEISMYGMVPWGGFGANPFPLLLQKRWDSTRGMLSGGFIYSEGIFEDINKVICTQLYYDNTNNALDILKDYISYEFSADCSYEIMCAVLLMEKGICRHRIDSMGRIHDYPDSKIPWIGKQRFAIEDTRGIDECYKLIMKTDKLLELGVKNSWRWRIIYLRAVIDYELYHNGFLPNKNCEKAFNELTEIYYADYADYCVAPPTVKSINENRGGFSWF